MSLLLVALGGSVGAIARYAVGQWILRLPTYVFPIGTILSNVSGSFLLGVLFALYTSGSLDDVGWSLFGVGFCGAYTTFSTFGLEAVTLLQERKFAAASIYIASSVVLGLIGAYVGMQIV